MMAMNLVNFAQYERELISERTKAAFAAKKRRGERIGRARRNAKLSSRQRVRETGPWSTSATLPAVAGRWS